MPRLVEADLEAARECDLRDGAPTRLVDRGAHHAALAQGAHLLLEVVAHEIQLGGRGLRRMHRGLGRGQAEDQPAAAVHGPGSTNRSRYAAPVSGTGPWPQHSTGNDTMIIEYSRCMRFTASSGMSSRGNVSQYAIASSKRGVMAS